MSLSLSLTLSPALYVCLAAVRPLIVKLQGENRPLSAENSYQLSCVVIGSRPAPTVTWWKGSTPMKNTHEIVSTQWRFLIHSTLSSPSPYQKVNPLGHEQARHDELDML